MAIPDLSGLGVRFAVKRGALTSFPPRYNVAPTQSVPVITNERERRMALFRFGLIPSWAKDATVANRLINARSETVSKLRSFRDAYLRRRCVVPVSGYYEWREVPGKKQKQPYLIQQKHGETLALAGVWESWVDPQGQVIESFALLTQDSDGTLRDLHDRMPVALDDAAADEWLSSEARRDPDAPRGQGAEVLTLRPVSPIVSSPKNDVPECIAPYSEPEVAAAASGEATRQLDLFLQAHPRRAKKE